MVVEREENMSGNYAIKGYLVQSLVSLLDSFKLDWETVSVEPNNESEKVDIRWIYKNKKKKFVQVKSSINTFTFSSAKRWANDLVQSSNNTADEYELILVGYVEPKLRSLKDNKIGNVLIINKDLSIPDFENLIITKINEFSHNNWENVTIFCGKPCISDKNEYFGNSELNNISFDEVEKLL